MYREDFSSVDFLSTTHFLSGQYQVLHQYVAMLCSSPEQHARSNFRYFTHIMSGHYFTVHHSRPGRIAMFTRYNGTTQRGTRTFLIDKKSQRLIQNILAYNRRFPTTSNNITENFYNPVYEEHFLRQIIEYHQILLNFKHEVSP